uniref:(California timema) hypothetical protein n=1 Tax=Timema californicum TaxID=61474 RepID=A0A7R9JG87_TIMCA|nr:unnamed protein product [Timema californicum]
MDDKVTTVPPGVNMGHSIHVPRQDTYWLGIGLTKRPAVPHLCTLTACGYNVQLPKLPGPATHPKCPLVTLPVIHVQVTIVSSAQYLTAIGREKSSLIRAQGQSVLEIVVPVNAAQMHCGKRQEVQQLQFGKNANQQLAQRFNMSLLHTNFDLFYKIRTFVESTLLLKVLCNRAETRQLTISSQHELSNDLCDFIYVDKSWKSCSSRHEKTCIYRSCLAAKEQQIVIRRGELTSLALIMADTDVGWSWPSCSISPHACLVNRLTSLLCKYKTQHPLFDTVRPLKVSTYIQDLRVRFPDNSRRAGRRNKLIVVAVKVLFGRYYVLRKAPSPSLSGNKPRTFQQAGDK